MADGLDGGGELWRAVDGLWAAGCGAVGGGRRLHGAGGRGEHSGRSGLQRPGGRLTHSEVDVRRRTGARTSGAPGARALRTHEGRAGTRAGSARSHTGGAGAPARYCSGEQYREQ